MQILTPAIIHMNTYLPGSCDSRDLMSSDRICCLSARHSIEIFAAGGRLAINRSRPAKLAAYWSN